MASHQAFSSFLGVLLLSLPHVGSIVTRASHWPTAATTHCARSPATRLDAAAASRLQQDLDGAVEARAERERALLQPGEGLVALKQRGGRGAATGVGFSGGAPAAKAKGKKKKTGKTSKGGAASAGAAAAATSGSVLAKELRKSGVVRIDGALRPETADALREFVDAERLRANAEVEAGSRDRLERFADLVLLANRCDVLLPLHGAVLPALDELLGEGSVLGDLLCEVVGEHAIFNEVACLISEPGSKQQPIHPDTPYTPRPPLYAAFVALQDVTLDMGPTVYLPGTHTKSEHTLFYGGDLERGQDRSGQRSPPIQEAYLASKSVKLGLLKKGDVALYNQQCLHCGSANESKDKVRRQFYISVRDPSVKGVNARPSIRPAFREKLTLGDVRDELRQLDGGSYRAGGKFAALDAADLEPAAAAHATPV